MSAPVSFRTAIAACLVLASPLLWAGSLPVPVDAKVVDQRPAAEQERVYPMGPLRKISGRLRVEDKVDDQEVATQLLERALRLGHDKADADEWLHSSAVKTHMRRMDPSFSEKALGYRSFSDFLKSRDDIAELEETGHERLVRLLEP